MKLQLLTLACVALLAASCSTPKMAYKFDYHDYNAGRKTKDVKEEVASNPGPVPVQPEVLVAATEPSEKPVMGQGTQTFEKKNFESKPYENMTKKERKAFVREVKKEIKKVVKNKDGVNSVQATQALDKDLKLAAIFGAVGVVALIISGQVFWIIGGIALIIGVVFFVKWLIRQ